ncbi:hypothetical protein B0H10DRAFT_820993 [Mycena sp. CBHHK59/15]|nr:hypothetical protein B0H10DRAFT_820993 [Mycena sp. CBHHK59/15]
MMQCTPIRGSLRSVVLLPVPLPAASRITQVPPLTVSTFVAPFSWSIGLVLPEVISLLSRIRFNFVSLVDATDLSNCFGCFSSWSGSCSCINANYKELDVLRGVAIRGTLPHLS